MIESIAEVIGISTTAVWALLAAAAVQLAVQIWALVDLAGRPRVRYDNKWIWALLIIFFGNSFIGPILYVALGRNMPEQVDVGPPAGVTSPADSERTRRAVDALYGDKSGDR